MKKKILLVLTILSLMISVISLQGFSTAQTVPSYVGVSEGNVYEWEIKMSNSTLGKMIDDLETLKNDFKNELGDLGNLNLSEFMKETLTGFVSDFLPEDWETLNATEFLEETIHKFLETINETFDLGLSGNWESMNITTFADEIIEGFDATDYTLFDVIDRVINETETTEFGQILPLDWETLTLKQLMGWELDNFMNNLLKNFTGDTFEIPGGWQNLNFSSFMAGIIPGLDHNFIDFIFYLMDYIAVNDTSFDFPSEIFLDFNMADILNETVYALNYSAGETGFPLDLTSCDMSDLLNASMMALNYEANTTIIPEDWDTMKISPLFEAIMINLNNSMPENESINILELNMSYFIDMMKMGINESLYNGGFDTSITAGALMHNLTLMMVYEINYSASFLYYNISNTWYELTVNELIDELWNLLMEQYTYYMTMFEAETGILGLGLKIKMNITKIFAEEEVEVGLSGTKINFTFAVNPGQLEYHDVSWDMGPVYILDPDDLESVIQNPIKALARQAYTSLLLFIGKTYDKSQITFRDMTMDMPEGMPDININMDWDSNGVLDHAGLKYGSDTVISISKPSRGIPEAIPGYEPIFLVGFSISSVIGLIYLLRRKNLVSKSI